MTDLTDLCAAALVATRHAYEDESNSELWAAAALAWNIAARAVRKDSGYHNPMADALTYACVDAQQACHDIASMLRDSSDGLAESYRYALTAAKVAMMWID